MSGSRGYDSRAYVSNAPGAFYVAYSGDFGATVPGAPTVAYTASSGSFASSTVYVQITWVTQEGESLPNSAIVEVNAANAQDVLGVTIPTVPTNGETVIGYRIYVNKSSGGTGAPLLVLAANSYTAMQTLGGLANVVPIATTVAYVKSQPASGVYVPAVDASGIQPALPSIASDATVDYYFIVPNTGSQWKQQKKVQYMRSDGVVDPSGIQISQMDFIQPDYPGTLITSGTSQANWIVTVGSWMVMNGYLFQATVGGAVAATFIGWSAFNTTKGATTTDGSVTWTSFGKAGVIRAVFGNLSGSPAVPAAQAYEFFQE